MHIFHHTVKPVLLYGSEIWGVFDFKKFRKQNDTYFMKLCIDLEAEKTSCKST